ncbi:hypothetical protein M885DRAFT_508227 [Pelagophyceae sp. CCMP2097]|nr:hypothetical protein M885DRAFT_508227 [Pelagophyceae sp. CCMP2097]
MARKAVVSLDLDAHGGIRGILALHVTLFHLLEKTTWQGQIGCAESSVTPFFILSGFTLAAIDARGSYRDSKPNADSEAAAASALEAAFPPPPPQPAPEKRAGKSTLAFYVARLARVAPVHYVTTAACVPLWYVSAGVAPPPLVFVAVRLAIQALFLNTVDGGFVPRYFKAVNDPAWTVGTLVIFWFMLPFLLPRVQKWPTEWLRRAVVWAFWLQAAAYLSILAFTYDLERVDTPVFYLAYQSPYSRFAVFFMGVAAGVWHARLGADDVVHWPAPLTWISPTTLCAASMPLLAGDADAWARVSDASAALWVGSQVTATILSLFHLGGGTSDRLRQRVTVATRRDLLIPGLCFLQCTCLFAMTLDQRRSRVSKFCMRPTLQWLGRVSMSLYLTHDVIYRYAYVVLHAKRGQLPGEAAPILFVIAVLASVVMFYGVEEPARKWLRPARKIQPKPPPSPPPAAPSTLEPAGGGAVVRAPHADKPDKPLLVRLDSLPVNAAGVA